MLLQDGIIDPVPTLMGTAPVAGAPPKTAPAAFFQPSNNALGDDAERFRAISPFHSQGIPNP